MYTKNGKQRRHLRGLAHALKPVVQLGTRGLTESILTELEAQIDHHELIKVKLSDECPEDIATVGKTIKGSLRGEVVQKIGHTLVIYRPRKKDPTIKLPAPS
jgi:RNA-binding protein